jgi:site-specific DNA recombinase
MELTYLWASSNYVEKRKIQFRIFPNGFYYDRKNDQPRTTKMNSVFALITRLTGIIEEQKTGTSEVILRNSG